MRLCVFAVKEMKSKITALLLFPSLLFAQTRDTVAERYSKNITTTGLSKNLHVLASDEYEGRETGKKGQKMAADYIAAQFRSFGIPPYKDDTYFQEFPLSVIVPSPAELQVNGKQYTGNKDYYNFPSRTEQEIKTNEVLFLGYGIDEPVYSDYKDVDVKEKVIMVLAGEPFTKDSLSVISGTKTASLWTTYFKTKSEKAKENGVAALLIVVEDVAMGMENNKHRLQSSAMKLATGEEKKEMPFIYISKEIANDILKKQNVDELKMEIQKRGKPLKKKAKANVEIIIKNNSQRISSENVLGYIEGADKKEELIIVTAHYDHIGKDDSVVFNGADDDGSGTVAVMELAKTFAKAKKEGRGPKRSMLFMTVAGEEKGLLGSQYYTSNPVYPLANTVCDLNIDMIGREDEKHAGKPDYVYLIGSDKLSSELHNISESVNKIYTQLDLDYTYNDENDKNRFYYRSDHYNFAKNNIPVIFYFNGTHADYHKETDEVEKIDFNKLEKRTRLVFFTAWELAYREKRIVVDNNKK